MVERVEQLEYDLLMLKDMAPVAAVNYIRKAIGYDDYLKEYADGNRNLLNQTLGEYGINMKLLEKVISLLMMMSGLVMEV